MAMMPINNQDVFSLKTSFAPNPPELEQLNTMHCIFKVGIQLRQKLISTFYFSYLGNEMTD